MENFKTIHGLLVSVPTHVIEPYLEDENTIWHAEPFTFVDGKVYWFFKFDEVYDDPEMCVTTAHDIIMDMKNLGFDTFTWQLI